MFHFHKPENQRNVHLKIPQRIEIVFFPILKHALIRLPHHQWCHQVLKERLVNRIDQLRRNIFPTHCENLSLDESHFPLAEFVVGQHLQTVRRQVF